MCIGESAFDTLQPDEQTFLRQAARDSFPDYDFRLHRNDDAMEWVVLEPERASAETPRFTFCRIDPCVMVMVEDRSSARRFQSLGCVEHAVVFALETTQRGLCAVMNYHEAPGVTQ